MKSGKEKREELKEEENEVLPRLRRSGKIAETKKKVLSGGRRGTKGRKRKKVHVRLWR